MGSSAGITGRWSRRRWHSSVSRSVWSLSSSLARCSASHRRCCRSPIVTVTVWNNGNLDLADELVSPNFVAHIAGFPAGSSEVRGPEAVKGVVRTFRAALPDLRASIEDQVAEGDKVASLVRFSGTHEGELLGIPPTGRRVTVEIFVLQYFSGERVVAPRSVLDVAELMQQLGVGPNSD